MPLTCGRPFPLPLPPSHPPPPIAPPHAASALALEAGAAEQPPLHTECIARRHARAAAACVATLAGQPPAVVDMQVRLVDAGCLSKLSYACHCLQSRPLHPAVCCCDLFFTFSRSGLTGCHNVHVSMPQGEEGSEPSKAQIAAERRARLQATAAQLTMTLAGGRCQEWGACSGRQAFDRQCCRVAQPRFQHGRVTHRPAPPLPRTCRRCDGRRSAGCRRRIQGPDGRHVSAVAPLQRPCCC